MTRTDQVQIIDRQTYGVAIIPKKFLTKFRPSLLAIAVYLAFNFDDEGDSGIPKLAKLVGVPEESFREGLAELIEKGAMSRETHKTPEGESKTVYEISNLY